MKTKPTNLKDIIRQTLGCGSLVVALTAGPQAIAAETFEMRAHPADIHGVHDLESGKIDRAIKRLRASLLKAGYSKGRRAPALIDLCVAYTMKRDLESATKYCDEAVDNGWNKTLARNNRGVLNAIKGDYMAAHVDFETAVRDNPRWTVAQNNLDRSEYRIAALGEVDAVTAVVNQ